MPHALFLPFDQVRPSEILSQYSEWIYFTLTLVFFISVAGITLKKHFDRPYVKPLIISVGLILTVGVFRFRVMLVRLFEGWGILGMVLLGIMAATIPYGLCRGLGLPSSKSFFLIYILFYILAWVRFPELFYALGDSNLGLVNLGLLIFFVLSVFKLVRFGRRSTGISKNWVSGPTKPEIDSEMRDEEREERVLKGEGLKTTEIQLRSIDDIDRALEQIEGIIATHRNSLPKAEREKIVRILSEISRKEGLVDATLEKVRALVRQLEFKNERELVEMKKRFRESEGDEATVLKAEIRAEEEKLRMEKEVTEYEKEIDQGMQTFSRLLPTAMERIRASPYPHDATPYLTEARKAVQGIIESVRRSKDIEKSLVRMIKTEERLLSKEKSTA